MVEFYYCQRNCFLGDQLTKLIVNKCNFLMEGILFGIIVFPYRVIKTGLYSLKTLWQDSFLKMFCQRDILCWNQSILMNLCNICSCSFQKIMKQIINSCLHIILLFYFPINTLLIPNLKWVWGNILFYLKKNYVVCDKTCS